MTEAVLVVLIAVASKNDDYLIIGAAVVADNA